MIRTGKEADSQPEKLEFNKLWAGVRTFGFHLPAEHPRGVLVLVHGFGEHSGRYSQSLIPLFTANQLSVIGFDLVGHGRSGGKRGYCSGYEQLLGQVKEACDFAQAAYPGIPLILYGHSMGGNLCLNAVLRNACRPDGVVASSPYLRLAFDPPAWKILFGRLLGMLWPSLTLPAGLDETAISRDLEAVKAYCSDPLVHGKISPNYGFPVIEAGRWALEQAGQWDIPILLAHGDADRLIDHKATIQFAEKASRSHVYLHKGGYHELHHDRGREDYFKALTGWLQDFLAP